MSKKSNKSSVPDTALDEQSIVVTRNVNLQLELISATDGPMDWILLVFFNGSVIFDTKWAKDTVLDLGILPFDLLDPTTHVLLADKPLIFLLRTTGGKANTKDPDPFTHIDNLAGGTVDLLPLVLGEDEIHVKVRLLTPFGTEIGCKVKVHAYAWGMDREDIGKVPFVMTMISVHCLPSAKDGTFYTAAVGLDGVLDPDLYPSIAVNFGLSINSHDAKKCVWASAYTAGLMGSSAYFAPNDDKFIPPEVCTENDIECMSAYWYSVKRVLVDPDLLRERLQGPLHIELAGVPRFGKIDVRGRFMGLLDLQVLLVPAQTNVTSCAKLQHYFEALLPENVTPCLELPPASAKSSAREPALLTDSYGHTPYVVIKFDLEEPLVPKIKIVSLFDKIGFPPPEKRVPLDELYMEPPPEDHSVDVRKIRNEGGALAVHKELGNLACRGAVPMNQGIKRTAANKLLTRVRTMLKQFSPGDCSYIEWQDTVTKQHAASRRAVTASFRPIPAPKKPTPIAAASRCRTAGDDRLAERHIEHNLKVAGTHPRPLFSKVLRLLEARTDSEAKNYLLRAMSSQSRNRFLLWVYGAMEFDKGEEALDKAIAAFGIAVKGDYSDGTSGAVGWAALHTAHHYAENTHSAFVAAQNMRKSYEVNKEWRLFLQRWIETSGEEEVLWIPGIIRTDNPLLIAAAFFLCLRCYKFSEKLLQCVEQGCATRGSRLGLKTKICPDIYYIRAASLILRREPEAAYDLTLEAIKRFGPCAMMSQMRAACLMACHGWDSLCFEALEEAERAGAEVCPSIMLRAAEIGMKSNPEEALQRVARVHMVNPSAHSALLMARILRRKGDMVLAERWAAAAVKYEPLLADGWAVLALLAMGDRNAEKARMMLRTARQVGSISDDIEKQIKKLSKVVDIDNLPKAITRNLCFCEYFHPNEEKKE